MLEARQQGTYQEQKPHSERSKLIFYLLDADHQNIEMNRSMLHR